MSRIVSPKVHWRRVGAGAARRGLALSAVTTGNAGVDRWIINGYHEVVASRERKARREYRMICGKAGIS